jgi:hypothetical protein
MENTPKTLKELFANTGIEPTTDENGNTHYHFNAIRKKEPKPHSFCETPEVNCTMNYCDDNGCQNRKRELVEPKQEKLEDDDKKEERRYSKEDMKQAFFDGIRVTGEGYNGEYASGNNPSIEEEFQEEFQEWLKQFKNK